ncbi:peptide ABC transporter permease [Alteribacter lacisalsi]|uniref:Peptide ABC transporter permease n=1 Tax=Alteribacter lacisalsi TaxID=2045244 RepID=A0A2W0HDZ0_9BACI|nr:ABC transporter permease [Alteribacter lacisalsi]PYZ99081.1 peptide ABC transporter permease [Alteribacter lacisalsi]
MSANTTAQTEAPLEDEFEVSHKPKPLRRWMKLLLRSKTGTLGLIIVLTVCFTALFAPLLAPYEPDGMNPASINVPPMWLEGGSSAHVLGTDSLGRDMLSRIIYGSQVSLLIGVLSVVVAGIIGLVLGIMAGYYGKWIDNIVMRTVDSFLAVPNILLILVVLGIFGSNLLTLILVLGVTNWVIYARLVRGEVLSLKERDFVRAAKSIGTNDRTIMMKHILPNVFSSFIVISTLSVATTIIIEASLSFLGLGVQPPTISWGYMLSTGRDYLATSWWLATFPGLAITITVLGIIFLGDWLRDVLDPRSQGRRS